MKITVTENKLQCFDYLVDDLCEALWALMAIPLSLSSVPVRLSSLRIPDATVFIILFMAGQQSNMDICLYQFARMLTRQRFTYGS